MKKIAALLTYAMAILVLSTSCEKETILTVDQTSLSFTDAGGSQSLSLTANKPWTVSSNQSWCKVSPTGGEEATSSKISISCEANSTYDARTATITFSCAELTKTVSISQATNNGLLISQTSYELTKMAQQLNIQVQANVKFSVEVDNDCKDWVKYNSTKGLTNSTVVLDIAENKTYDYREGKVTIKQDGGNLSSTITIKQSQLDGLFITTSEYILSNEKHTLTVEVSTNVEFDVKPEADWVKYVQTKGLVTKQIILEVEENETYDQRETIINVKQKNGDLSGVIQVKQGEKKGLILSQTSYNLSEEEQTIDVEVKSNVEYDIVIPNECKDWIKLIQTKSLVSKTSTFAISRNNNFDSRECDITFKQKNGPLCETVHITQKESIGLIINPQEFNINSEEQIIEVEVQSNSSYSYDINVDWLQYTGTKSLTSKTLCFRVKQNTSYDARTGKIKFFVQNTDICSELSITQSGAVKVESIVFGQEEIALYIGELAIVSVVVLPNNAFDKTVSWSSEDENIVSISQDGYIRAKSPGSTRIVARAGDIEASCKVLVIDNANCYIISSPGTYYIPLVKGKTTDPLTDVRSVDVLWESFGTDVVPKVGDIISSVQFRNNVVSFKTPSKLKNGNALIAVKDQYGSIIWSWHIWVCKDYDPDKSSILFNRSNQVLMDRNVGALSSKPGEVLSFGLYYQYGRKDPFLGPSKIAEGKVPAASSTGTWPYGTNSNQIVGTMEFAIANPTTFILYGYNNYGDWFYYPKMTHFWGYERNYNDPCPAGWTINYGSSWFGSYADERPYDNENKGIMYNSPFATPASWYPAAGETRDGKTFEAVGIFGYYWTQLLNTDSTMGLAFSFSSDTYQLNVPTGRATGMPVRCVKEQ